VTTWALTILATAGTAAAPPAQGFFAAHGFADFAAHGLAFCAIAPGAGTSVNAATTDTLLTM
jgi:hypothetical protein